LLSKKRLAAAYLRISIREESGFKANRSIAF